MMPSIQSKSLSWDVVEKAIAKETEWLRKTIVETPYKDKNICKGCIFRRLAVLILSGNTKARDIKSTISLFGKETSPIGKSHGKEWHVKIMKLSNNYFKSLGYDVTLEPNLNMGRADLGIYKNGERDLFIEVGTVSLPKLLFNLESMEGSDFLLVLDSNHAVEFSILKANFKYQTI